MHKSNRRLGQQPMSRWRKWLTQMPYKAIATEYQGQMTPVLLEDFYILVVDTPYRKKLRQKKKIWKSAIETGAEVGPAWYIMSKFTKTNPHYNYRALSKEGIIQVFVEKRTGFDGIVEAFAKDPQHFSIAGFEQQYAPQELVYLQDISNCYQRLGARKKNYSAIKSTSIAVEPAITSSRAEGLYARIFTNRYEPTFSSMWHDIITTAASYINLYSASRISMKYPESNVSVALDTFIAALETLVNAIQKNNDDDDRWFEIDWLSANGQSIPDRQICTEFAGYLLLFDTLQSNSTMDDDNKTEQSITIQMENSVNNYSKRIVKIMHKSKKKKVSRYLKHYWYNKMIYSTYVDKAISIEYEGQMIPLYLPAYDVWVVDTEFSRKELLTIKTTSTCLAKALQLGDFPG